MTTVEYCDYNCPMSPVSANNGTSIISTDNINLNELLIWKA